MMNFLNLIAVRFMNALPFNFMVGDPFSGVGGKLGDLYSSILQIVTPIAVLAILFCGIRLLMASDPQSTKQAKSWLITILVGMFIAYGARAIADYMKSLAESIGAVGDITSLL